MAFGGAMQRRMGSMGPAQAAGSSGLDMGSIMSIAPQAIETARMYQSGQGTGNSQLDTIQKMAGIAQSLGPQMPESVGPKQVDTGPISRRMETLGNAPLMQLRSSIDSLKYVESPEQRAALAKPLLQAEYMAKRGGA